MPRNRKKPVYDGAVEVVDRTITGIVPGGQTIAGDENVFRLIAGIYGEHLLVAAQEGSRYSEQHQGNGDLRGHQDGAQPGMAFGRRADWRAFLEAIKEVGLYCRKAGRQAAKDAGSQRDDERKDGDGCVNRDGVDARHRLRQKM